MTVVLNWLDLQLSDEDLKRVAEGLERPIKLRLVLQKLVKALLSQHPWTTRTDTIHLFHPSHRYEVNQSVAMPKFPEGTWCIAQVIEVKEDQNPKQGKFQIVRLRANGEEKAYAASIPDAQPLPFKIDPKRLQDLANYFVESYETQLRNAFLQALERFPILIYLLQTDEVSPISFVVPLEDSDLNIVEQLFAQNPREAKRTEEIVAYLRSQGRLTNLSDEQATIAVKELLERNGYVLVSEDEWLSPEGAEVVDRSLQRRSPAPVIRDDNEYYETVVLPPEGRTLAEEFGEGEEEAAEEKQLSLDEWRERARTQPLKLPPLTFQNIMEAYFPLNRQLSEFLPPGDLKRVYLRFHAYSESEPMTFWVSRTERDKRGLKADELDKERFRQWLISQGIPAGTTFWIERISDFEYRLYAKPLDPPRIVGQVKFPSIQNGELKFELEEVQQRWEGDPHIFKAELRFEDLRALHEEASKVGLRIATIVRRVFEQIDPNGQGLYWSEVFNATYLVRMCSPRTVLGVLYEQPCFESLGNGRFRLKPEVPLRIVRRPPIRHPKIEHFELPKTIWANSPFAVKVRTKYCQQVTLEHSQDGHNWQTFQTLSANPDGQKTHNFKLSLPEAGRWQLRIKAVTPNGATLTKQMEIQVQPMPVTQPKPEEREIVEEFIATLPFTLPQTLFPIPFASEPLSESVFQELKKLTNQHRLLLSLSPREVDELLQQRVAESGQFVTHRLIADFMVNLAQPKPNESIADICCGSGIFLVKALRFVREVYGEDKSVDLFGADVRPIACNAARLNLEANGFSDSHVILEMDSLNAKLQDSAFDVIFGNPPFDLAKVTSFLHRWMKMLKEGGRMVVLVPSGILTGSQQRNIRERLVNEGTILAIVALPKLGGIYGAAGNVLFWLKKTPEPEHEPLLVSIQSEQNLEAELREVLEFCFFEDEKRRIMRYLRQNPSGLRTYELARMLGYDLDRLRQYLTELAGAQMVRCVRCDEDGYERWFALG